MNKVQILLVIAALILVVFAVAWEARRARRRRGGGTATDAPSPGSAPRCPACHGVGWIQHPTSEFKTKMVTKMEYFLDAQGQHRSRMVTLPETKYEPAMRSEACPVCHGTGLQLSSSPAP